MIPYAHHDTLVLETVRHTDQLPALAPVAVPAPHPACSRRLTPADVVELPYSPAFLLPVPFDQVITTQKRYRRACQAGYRGYFEFMWDWNEQGGDLIFVEQVYRRSEVLKIVVEELKQDDYFSTPLAWRAGFILGWLSALAFTDLDTAHAGIQLAAHLVQLEQGNGHTPVPLSPCTRGADGWPLDE